MSSTIEEIAAFVRDIRLRSYPRDQRMGNLKAVRAGDVSQISPGLFPDYWPKPIIANTIDVAASYTAEQMAVMPTVFCTSGIQVSDLQKKFAFKRTNIVHFYMDQSHLDVALIEACDWFNSYGFLPIIVEPHFGDAYCSPGPRVKFDTPLGAYYDLDNYRRCRKYVKVYEEDSAKLIAKFPHLERAILGDMYGTGSTTRSVTVEMVQYMDDDEIVTYLPRRNNLIINRTPNKFGRCPVFICERPKFDDQTRGALDDVIWIQLARAKFALLGLEAAEFSVTAPTIVPDDVQDITFGADQLIRTHTPQGVRKLELPVNPAAFQVGELLAQEATVGARFPEGATGKSPGSVVTGRGMQELMGTIDTKVKTLQVILGGQLQNALSACLEMDEKFWPNLKRQVRVDVKGSTYEADYTPRKDINGVYQVKVTYGMAAGMDPNRAIVFLLQARGDKLISRAFALSQLPFDLNPDQIEEEIDTEELNDALKQGFAMLLSNIGEFVVQGQDPTPFLLQAAQIIKDREKGKPLADAFIDAFKSPPSGSGPPGAGAPPSPGAPGPQAPGGGAPPGAGPPGMGGPPGGSPGMPGQQGQSMSPQDMLQLLAGSSGGGTPSMGASVKRKIPITG
jgi:hypothetical protein